MALSEAQGFEPETLFWDRVRREAQHVRLVILIAGTNVPSLQDLALYALVQIGKFNVDIGTLLKQHRLLTHNFYHGGIIARLRKRTSSVFVFYVRVLTHRPIPLRGVPAKDFERKNWPLTSLRLPTGTAFGSTEGIVLEAAEPVDGNVGSTDEIHLFLITSLPVAPSVLRRVVARSLKKGKIWGPAAAALETLPSGTYGTFLSTARFGLKVHQAVPLVFKGRNVWCPYPMEEVRTFDLSKIRTRFLPHLEKTIKLDLLRLRKRAFVWAKKLWGTSCLAELVEKVWEESESFTASFRQHGQFCVCEICILLRRASPTE